MDVHTKEQRSYNMSCIKVRTPSQKCWNLLLFLFYTHSILAKKENNVLVALMNNQKDFLIAQEQLWYRIPVKSAPPIIKEGKAKLISFYHTSDFEKEKFTIRWFGEIKKIEIVKRKELFPEEAFNGKSNNEYYKVGFAALKQLPIPIIIFRPRRFCRRSWNGFHHRRPFRPSLARRWTAPDTCRSLGSSRGPCRTGHQGIPSRPRGRPVSERWSVIPAVAFSSTWKWPIQRSENNSSTAR